MATLVLQVAGSAIGGMLGGPVGAVIGQAVGAMAGAAIDGQLFGAAPKSTEGPRLGTLDVTGSTEGAAVPKIYGRARLGGQIVWATRFEEVAATTRQGASGGKGARKATTTTYSYYASFAVALCEGPIAMVRRIWADGKELDQTKITLRVHVGSEDQQPDPLIAAREGASGAPAYRGLAYVVFERLPLADFGNRIPLLSFEVVRPVNDLSTMLRGVTLIPGASEFAYAPAPVTALTEPGVSEAQNRRQLIETSDVLQSLDALQATCPNVKSVALVVSWFGDDLRAGRCAIAPRVETGEKSTYGGAWSVAGLARAQARVVSQVDGAPAYGGTPSDESVRALLRELKARGFHVVFYPFVMMDVPAGNELPDPWSGASAQPAFPWRGRIVCDPAPGRAGSPDGSADAAAQIASFFGSDAPPAQEWSYRRMVLHYAQLCAQEGGVDAFLVGSELVGLTRVRSAPGAYPAVAELTRLAADAKTILGSATNISYAADWTEYGAHVRDNGAEVRFPLDPFWASPHVDFVAVDAYWPLSDWRDGADHADAALAPSVHDRAYLASRLRAGEDFDWHYADAAARAAQNRTPITDGAYGKPWIFRAKDLSGWWSNAHVERSGGVELAASTAWAPASKPVWLTEIGCPAVDRGANQPNVFPDAKSSESAQPHFSRGSRDDFMQIATLEAMMTHFDPASEHFSQANNPVSPVYGARMVEPSRIHVWAWDARPFPAFPRLSGVWSDAANWETGHWIMGRVEGAALAPLVAQILSDFGLPADMIGRIQLDGMVDGYAIDRPMSARAALDPLLRLSCADLRLSGGRVEAGLSTLSVTSLLPDDLVETGADDPLRLTRAQDSDLPHEVILSFQDAEIDYRRASVASRRLEGASLRQTHGETGLVLARAEAMRRADAMLHHLWRGRESVEFSLSRRHAALEPGDHVLVSTSMGERRFAVASIAGAETLRVVARAVDPHPLDNAAPVVAAVPLPPPRFAGRARVEILELAVDRGAATLAHLAVFAEPWPGQMAVWRDTGETVDLLRLVDRPAVMGETLSEFPAGPAGRMDRAASLVVRARGGALQSAPERQILAGANLCALRGPDGAWEICAFAQADLVGAQTWRLSRFLRGLGGEDALCERVLAAGATFVLLDDAVVPLASGLSSLGASIRVKIGPADRDPSDSSFVRVETLVGAKALKPYAPVRLAARRDSAGVRLSWLRRSRRDADAWEPLDIPLGEDAEAYTLDILAGDVVKRRVATSLPSFLYPNADEIADFGAPQSALRVRIAQRSAVIGDGFARVADLPVS